MHDPTQLDRKRLCGGRLAASDAGVAENVELQPRPRRRQRDESHEVCGALHLQSEQRMQRRHVLKERTSMPCPIDTRGLADGFPDARIAALAQVRLHVRMRL